MTASTTSQQEGVGGAGDGPHYFVDYDETTNDPGYSMILIVILVVCLANCGLPIWIRIVRRVIDWRRGERETTNRSSSSDGHHDDGDDSDGNKKQNTTSVYTQTPPGGSSASSDDEKEKQRGILVTAGDGDANTNDDGDNDSTQHHRNGFGHRHGSDYCVDRTDRVLESGDNVSVSSSKSSIASSNILSDIFDSRRPIKAKAFWRRKKAAASATTTVSTNTRQQQQQQSRAQIQGQRRQRQRHRNASTHEALQRNRKSSSTTAATAAEAAAETTIHINQHHHDHHHDSQEDDEDEYHSVVDIEVLSNAGDTAAAAAVTAEINNGHHLSTTKQPTQPHSSTTGSNNWFNTLLDISTIDKEMKKLCKVSVPFAFGGLVDGFFGLVFVAIIGHWINVRAANAYIVSSVLSELTQTVNYGFAEAIGTLGPQADGVGNSKLVGEYMQLSIIFFVLGSIPITILWAVISYDAIIWFGFDESTAQIGKAYAIPFNIYQMIMGVNECLQTFLIFTDHEWYSLKSQTVEFVIQMVTVVIVVGPWANVNDLGMVGYIQCLASVLFVVGNYTWVIQRGWLDKYWDGFAISWSLGNAKAVANFIRTAVPLSLSWILTYGEWELITVFVSAAGPAEVAAWGLLGYVWEVFEYVTEAIAAAGEVRVGHHMGGGRYIKAKRSAYKAIYLALVISVYVTALVYMFSEQIVKLLTPDPTLQRMVLNAFPLVGIGQVGLAASTVCWDIMGAQGRIRLATFIGFAGSWLITLPFSALSVIVFTTNIQGPTAGVVFGYTISGAVMIAHVVMADWSKWSKFVVEQNKKSRGQVDTHDLVSEFDDSSASSASSAGCKYDRFEWHELPRDVKKACKILCYTPKIWDNDGKSPLDDMDYDDLTEEQQRATGVLGYTKATWNGDDVDEDDVDKTTSSAQGGIVTPIQARPILRSNSSSSSYLSSAEGAGKYDSYDWEELPKDAWKAATILCYTQNTWDNDLKSPLDSKNWVQLTRKQQIAATVLGYTQTAWDDDDDDSDSSDDINNDVETSPLPPPPPTPQPRVTSSSVSSDSSSSSSDDDDTGLFNDLDWAELPKEAILAANVMGYTQHMWDNDLKGPLDKKDWTDLTAKQKLAAKVLGYSRSTWD